MFKCQGTSNSALLAWRLAARASRQADGTQSATMVIASGGREGSARRNGAAETLMVQWCLAREAGAPGGDEEWRLAAWWVRPAVTMQ